MTAWPSFMALLTISKESALTKAGNSALLSNNTSQISREIMLARVKSTLLGIPFTQQAQKFSA